MASEYRPFTAGIVMKVEIHGGSDFVSIEVLDYENAAAKNSDDANWLDCNIRLKASIFSGEYQTTFRTEDFVEFHRQLAQLRQLST
jgi:hypothetical protein